MKEERSFSRNSVERNERGQSMRNCSIHRTVCEVLREINDLHQGTTQTDITTRLLAHEAMGMAKRMDRKLKEYNKEYDADWWERNQDYEHDLERRLAADYIAMDDAAIPEGVRRIPSMGGREIGRYLREWASECPDYTNIIELGVWHGAGTAQLALGVKQSGKNVMIHGFDRFTAGPTEVEKAANQGVQLTRVQDTLPVVIHNLASCGLGKYCLFTKGAISAAQPYDGLPISMYVDDACKRKTQFLWALRNFGPHWIPGVTVVVLMDFWYFEQKTGDKADFLKFQHNWMGRHAECFEVLKERLPGTSASAFRYLGGNPWRDDQ